MTEQETDRENARLLIMQGKDIPEDLADRLLQYKRQDEKREKGKAIEKR